MEKYDKCLKRSQFIFMLLTAVFVLVFGTSFNSATSLEKRISQLEEQLSGAAPPKKIEILNKLASATYTAAPAKCIEYCQKAIDLAEKNSYPKGKARALIQMSYALSVLGDWDRPFTYSNEALSIYKRQGDRNGIGKALSALGYFYLRIDYFNIALDYFLKSLRIYEELGNKDRLYLPNVNLGSLYANLEDYPKAIEYYQNALDLVKEQKDDKRVPYCLHNIGLCYLEMGGYDRAMKNILQSLELFENSGDEFWISAALNHLGKIYLNLDDIKRALSYLFQARQLREKLGDKVGLFITLCLTGDAYLKKKDYTRATAYYNQAFPIAEKLDDKNNLEIIYKNYSILYAEQNDYQKAFENYRKYTEIKDLLFNEKKNKQLAELQVRFDSERRAREIEILKKDNKIKAITRNTFIAGFFSVLIMLILLFRKYLYLLAFWRKQKYIGQYRVIKTIDSGGMGTVYLGHPIREKKRLMAIKVLKEEFLEDEISRQRFKHEGVVIDKLQHPNIVRVFERGEYKEKLYIAMEYLQGKTLDKVIKEEKPLNLKKCLVIMTQLADGLAFIHNKNIVHRDIKPANIMLVQNDNQALTVKLLDFGVALTKFQTRLTRSGILVGTINYIAPEQITNNSYSYAGDIYSLGITFYEMVAGKSPFPADTITEVVEKILAKKPENLKQSRTDLPDVLNDIIMKMLVKKPAERPSAKEVLNSLTHMKIN